MNLLIVTTGDETVQATPFCGPFIENITPSSNRCLNCNLLVPSGTQGNITMSGIGFCASNTHCEIAGDAFPITNINFFSTVCSVDNLPVGWQEVYLEDSTSNVVAVAKQKLEVYESKPCPDGRIILRI